MLREKVWANSDLFTVAFYRGLSWEGTFILWSVEIHNDAEDLVRVMAKMREWLDARRIVPDIFRHTVEGPSVTILLQFNVEREAIAFAQAFAGQLL